MVASMLVQNVTGLQFSLMGPDEIRTNSVVAVDKSETYDNKTDTPIVKGLFDLRMGSTEMGKVCTTCGQQNMKCPGHFGHIELARPIYHYHFLDITMKVIKCVCFRCSRLLVDPNSPQVQNLLALDNKTRFKALVELSAKIGQCGQSTEDGCGCPQPNRYKQEGISGITGIWKNLGGGPCSQLLSAEYVKTLFEGISEEDYVLLGFTKEWSRPEWLICTVLPVPPPSVRPSAKKQGDSQRMEDDLTNKFSEIVKYNNMLRDKIAHNVPDEIITDYTDLVQYHVATMIDNDIPGVSKSSCKCSGRPLKSIQQRLKGKDGRIRSNLMGKRVDFSARSVITPDPNIAIDELGVPSSIASNLTYPDKVHQYNVEDLRRKVRNGPDVWPGAKSILKGTQKITLSVSNKNDMADSLEMGDIVNRHLNDGDYVLFNRQPSLHKMSMMGHRVKVMSGNTFRLNVSVTPPYNADFDGDEMNMHVPQSIQSVSELVNIASVNHQIISPRENKPIITIVQDTLLGIYKLTHLEVLQFPTGEQSYYGSNTNLYDVSDVPQSGNAIHAGTTLKCVDTCVFTRAQLMNLICDLSTYSGSPPKPDRSVKRKGVTIELWSGKAVLSLIIPTKVNLKMPNGRYDSVKDSKKQLSGVKEQLNQQLQKDNSRINLVKIVNGQIQSGTFDKSLFSKTSKGLIHTINNDFGPMRAHDFINDLQKIVTYFLLVEGFSVGISDMIADRETNETIRTTIEEKKGEIEGILQEVHLDLFEPIAGQTKNAFFEEKVNAKLNKTIAQTGKIALNNLDPKNRVTYMVNSGSKGKDTNISQMVACLGQQNVDGGRIPYGFPGRTLPHYYKYDDSSEARGFVENSFISGQTPQEFYFHAMGGREGLIDTAVKTAATGYVQRQLVKAMEDLVVTHDFSVRTSAGNIVQFVYGNDGMDATYVESQPLYLTKLDDTSLSKRFLFPKTVKWSELLTTEALKGLTTAKAKQSLNESFTRLLKHREYLCKVVFQGDIENNINYPVHIERIVANECTRDATTKTRKSTISPLEILKGNEVLRQSKFVRDSFENNEIFGILVDIHLAPKVLIEEHRITKGEYQQICDTISHKFDLCKISPGEMVGALAAQSIGEPATQMTLNTFHLAGVSAKSNVTRGIPRLKELIHVSKNMKSPATTVYLRSDMRSDLTKTRYVKNSLEHTRLREMIVQGRIYYDPLNVSFATDIPEDQELLAFYKEFRDLEEAVVAEETEGDVKLEAEITSPWILRFTFEKELMMECGVTMEDISLAIHAYDSERIRFIYTDDNCQELVGRMSLILNEEPSFENGIQDQSSIISQFKHIMEDMFENITIKGISGISNILIDEDRKLPETILALGEESSKEHVLEADGVALLDILNNPYTDETRCLSNDIVEIYRTLGVEAARTLLVSEVTDIAEHAGEYINSRHIEVLCDTMTNRGNLMPINRQGIGKGDAGPLAKCSFEDTTDQLVKAAIFAEKDNLQGVSSNIMMGQKVRSGTGMADILLDEEEFYHLIREENKAEAEYDGLNESTIDKYLEGKEIHETTGCATDDFKFSFE